MCPPRPSSHLLSPSPSLSFLHTHTHARTHFSLPHLSLLLLNHLGGLAPLPADTLVSDPIILKEEWDMVSPRATVCQLTVTAGLS